MVSFGISTWSLHRALSADPTSLLDVPRQLRAHGLTDLQVCHFHLPQTNDAYLAELRQQITAHGVTLDALLIDFGDISHAEQGDADASEMERWLTIASTLGARHARISAGHEPPTHESLARVAARLLRLCELGRQQGVRVITENWHAMLPNAREVLRLIELTNGQVPLCLDFGNWTGPTKYDELAKIAPHAVTVHAKCRFSDAGKPDAADFTRCCEVLRDASFAGTVALIYDGGPSEEWRYLGVERSLASGVWNRRSEPLQGH